MIEYRLIDGKGNILETYMDKKVEANKGLIQKLLDLMADGKSVAGYRIEEIGPELDTPKLIPDYQSAAAYLGESIVQTGTCSENRLAADAFNRLLTINRAWNKNDKFKSWDGMLATGISPIFTDGKEGGMVKRCEIFRFKTQERASEFTRLFGDDLRTMYGFTKK